MRGFRIELGEIEAALAAHEALTGAVVVARDGRLVAYTVPSQGTVSPSAGELRDFLRRRLPEHMVPLVFVFLPELPLTPNGKVDRKALPASDGAVRAGRGFVAPRTPEEELLAGLWSELLGVERVGMEDDFFELGGHSLLAARVAARVRSAFGVELPLRSLFEAPTVAGIAGLIASAHRLEGAPEAPIAPVPRTAEIPLSWAQERLWFLDRLAPANSAYNVPLAVRLTGELDPGRIADALAGVARRHEVLRTRFGEADGRPVQVIDPEPSLPVRSVDLSVLPAEERESEARRLLEEEARRPFDLARGPLGRALLVRLAGGEHVALINLHHIVTDGWSTGVLLREVAALYGGMPLPALPVQYADYAVWQREWLQGPVLEAQIGWWRERLDGAPPELPLPADRPRPARPTLRGGRVPVSLDAEVWREIQALASARGATPFILLLAAFQTLLARLSGEEDVLVGSPVANRRLTETEGLIGFFINTLVMRTSLVGDPPFHRIVEGAREAALGAWAHQDVPFERLVEELQPERDLARPPFFQTVLVLQNTPMPVLELPGLTLEPVETDTGTAKFDLMLSLTQRGEPGGGAAGWLEYGADRFDRPTAERIVAAFERLTAAAMADSRQRLSDLPLLAEEERRQILFEWNNTATPYPREALVHELFEEQAERSPDRVALLFGDESVTYGDLNVRANRLAYHLHALGVGPEVRVGLCLDRSPDLVTAILGILKAGGVYVPLDPSYPRERIEFMLEDTDVAILLTERQFLPSLPSRAARHVVLVDAEREAIARRPATRPLFRGLGPDGLAYVMYTSGSTGLPKGVAVPHRAIVRLVRNTDYARFADDEVYLQLAPISFDASTLEIWGALANGALLAVFPPGTPSLEEVGREVERLGVTSIWLTAGFFHLMVDGQLASLRGLHQLLAGGDVLSVPHVRRVLAELPGCRMINGYGPTENTTFTCCHTVTAESLGSSVPLGKPIANTVVYVLDRALQPVPPGLAGELYAGGDGLARGYLNRPELTAERFVPDPWSSRPGGRLYRTGDLVRRRPSGLLEFIGRTDSQVKLRGFRIEPAEIEAVLCGHSAVAAACVLVREQAGDKRLVAFAAVEDGPARPTSSGLRAFLQERLPDYMVPSAFVLVGELPLNANGKVDRGALSVLAAAEMRPETSRAPRTPLEEMLAGLWAELLALDRVGVDDNFFELGGHSLLATRLVSRVREAFGIEIPLRVLFESPTVAALAEAIENVLQAERGGEAPPLVARPRAEDEEAPLSFGQERLWFLDRLDPGSAAYNVPAALRLEGQLDVAAFRNALSEVARRHEALRTTFPERAGRPVQRITAPEPVAIPVIDLAGLGEWNREAERWLRGEAERPFDLAEGPLLRARLLRLGDRDWAALLTLHHIVSDGWSMGVLVHELGVLYAAFAAGEASPLPELPVQYADYAVWQREWLAGGVLEAQLAWWRERLAGAPAALELPTDRPRAAVQSLWGGEHPVALTTDLSRQLRNLSRQEGATLFMTLLSGFQVLLSRYSGQEDMLVGSPVANRTRGESEGLIGFFVNTLVLRGRPAAGRTFRELLAEVRDASLEAYARQDLPFERLVEELRPERDLSRPPLVQVMLTWQDAPLERLALPGLTLCPVRMASANAKLELTLALGETEQNGERRVTGALEYAAALFDPATTLRLVGHLETLLRGAMEEPERRIGELPLMTAVERHQLEREWIDLRVISRDACLHQLFEIQVGRTPAALALACGAERLTYEDLDRRANHLAHRLRAMGIGPERAVGVCLERSESLVIALLAVLKAGGAYVPLDPAYPSERLAFVVGDAHIAVLISRESLLRSLPGLGWNGPFLCLDAEGTGAKRDAGPEAAVGPDNLAYFIYTSGSTGRPKGVAIEHASAVALVRWAREVFPPEDLAGVLASTSIAFDLSVFELFVPLSWGGAVVLAGSALDLPSVEARVTLVNTVPSAMAELVRLGGVPDSVRTVNLAGEPLKRALAEKIHERTAAERLFNLYGPSEDTTYSTFTRVVPGEEPTIGRPVAWTQGHVLDAQMQPAPVGVPGELLLGGGGLARGYLHRPELTAEKFIPNPFGAPGSRLYRTGDLARWRSDGDLEFLGRRDFQVKIRGFRIELGEIETALAAHPAVTEVVVLALPLGEDVRLVAFWVGEEEVEPRSWLRRTLPEHMVPSAFVRLEALPLNPNGKVDRQALAKLGAAPLDRPESGAPGAGPLEELLAGVWEEVLHVERVGPHDDFFELGGHSLLATQVVSRVREALGVELPLRALFGAPTVAALAAEVARLRGEAGPEATPPLVSVPRDGDLPLSFAQERLWFLDQLEPGTGTFNLPAAVRLTGRFRCEVFERSLTEIVRRHEALRTTFGLEGERPVQVIAPPGPVVMPLIDLSGMPNEVRHLAGRLAAEEAARPFDLARGPLIRSRLLRLGPEEHVALVTVHHIVSDGWSMGVFLRELTTLYRAFAKEAASPLPEPTVQYADYGAWQRAWLQGPVRERQLAWWRERLDGAAHGVELPADRPRPAVQTFRPGQLSLRLSGELSNGLRALSRREGATLFMTLLAVFELLLARHSGQEDVTVGTPIAGRGRSEVEGLIGFFLNTLVLRTDLAGNPAFRELLGRVRETALGAYAHQDVPFEMLLEELRPERDLSRTPFFQVMFNMLNFPQAEAELPDLAVEAFSSPAAGSKFDLTLYVADRPDGIGIEWVYNADLFDGDRIALLARQLDGLLAQAVEQPASPIDAFSLLTEEDRAALPDPAAPLVPEWHGAVHERFARMAQSAPERTAILDGDRVRTYGELNVASDRLAHHLRANGVGTGDVVAIYAQRGAGLVLGLLGTLKTGAAFLVLDSAYPEERLASCVAQARPRALLAMEAAGGVPAGLEKPLCSVTVSEDWSTAAWAAAAPGFAPPPVGPDDLAYVAFTSGSTGVPKGILGSHGPLSHFLTWHIGASGLNETDRFSMLSGLSHDPLLRDVFTPLCLGAALCIPRPAEMLEPEKLMEWLSVSGVTVAHLTPAMGQLLDPGDAAGTLPLRRAFFGGGVLDGRDVERLHRLAPGCTAVNFYGTTETPQAMGFHVAEATEGVVPLGRGIDGVQLLVIGRSGSLAAPGERGEIHVRTPYLSLGYLGDSGLTAERFVTNPWTGQAGDRLYRTGDLGRYRLDGEVEFLGRADDQVSVRGFRVEPGEVQAALCRHPRVKEAVITAVEQEGETRLAAYVVPDGELRTTDLRQFLRRRLPDFMVPSYFLTLEALPLTPNGKVDRRSLPAPGSDRPDLESPYVEPVSDLERTIAGIWREVLKLERVGIHDSFFELGGSSLAIARARLRLREALQRELPLVDLFRHPTVAALAAHLERPAGGPASPGFSKVEERVQRGKAALQRQQQRMKGKKGV
ncbi:MAG TPA: amino acid adenylation domain-containing protein [Thermoanaerobaculia bacterium]|nr:amino acid adenylation domain-containing protein [Thermoanaerobaculia bacterium]